MHLRSAAEPGDCFAPQTVLQPSQGKGEPLRSSSPFDLSDLEPVREMTSCSLKSHHFELDASVQDAGIRGQNAYAVECVAERICSMYVEKGRSFHTESARTKLY